MTYETIRRIGRGGMGVVDLARSNDGTLVALKRLSLHGTPEEIATARQRISREAEVLRQLHHRSIVGLREVINEGDDLILAMDYLPGGNLAQRVVGQGPLTAEQVGELCDQLLGALASAHRQGIVHRDIKPANVLFDDDGNALLADFGVALHRDATVGLTGTEMVVGTPGFMAPEQARGEDATAASDVFSLGATLAFAATGNGPFGAVEPRVAMMRAAAGKTEKLPRGLDPDLRKRLERMLAADPTARPTAAALLGGPEGTDPNHRVATHRGWNRGRRIAVGTVVALMLVAASGAVLLSQDGNQGRLSPTSTTPTAVFLTSATEATTCLPLPFQPCGSEPAPNTDGSRCNEGFDNYDGDPTTGCEAEADDLAPDTELLDLRTANLVPAEDVDTYLLTVSDRFQLDCGGAVRITLTAAVGVTQRVTVLDSGQELETAIGSDQVPVTVRIGDPNCGTNDSTTLTVRVESVGTERTAGYYTIEAAGSF